MTSALTERPACWSRTRSWPIAQPVGAASQIHLPQLTARRLTMPPPRVARLSINATSSVRREPGKTSAQWRYGGRKMGGACSCPGTDYHDWPTTRIANSGGAGPLDQRRHEDPFGRFRSVLKAANKSGQERRPHSGECGRLVSAQPTQRCAGRSRYQLWGLWTRT
jgi:hypothetical protein